MATDLAVKQLLHRTERQGDAYKICAYTSQRTERRGRHLLYEVTVTASRLTRVAHNYDVHCIGNTTGDPSNDGLV